MNPLSPLTSPLSPQPGVLILAAGRSQRMGRPKLLLPWGGTSVLGRLIQSWEKLAPGQIAVVCAPDADAIRAELDRLGFPEANRVVNPMPERGMFSSIQCAARWAGWNPDLTHWIVTLGDQPQIQSETMSALIEFGAKHSDRICQPVRAGRRKHPVWMPRSEFMALSTTAATDLKGFLTERAGVSLGFESDDAGLDFDLDTPEDYERMMRIYFGGPQ